MGKYVVATMARRTPKIGEEWEFLKNGEVVKTLFLSPAEAKRYAFMYGFEARRV